MASDGGLEGRVPRRRATDFVFKWVSSSPTPVEVARMESRFPAVVRVPEALLEEEIAGWLHRAVIVRSFSKWVPVEAYIREFRRAGIPGVIEPISLAFRCHIFRFEDTEACSMVLNRPWTINGQVIGTEAWHPGFFPAEDSVASAMIWMRMPNLPMEFWHEDILRAISEPAGAFCFADTATVARNRGGYARMAVRADLLHSLRPGTRVQGIHGPFWQQFVFESLEGLCLTCGSLHLNGRCSASEKAEGDEADGGPVFGPWMSAIRQRRYSGGSPSKDPTSAMGSCPASLPVSSDASLAAGWKTQGNKSRRRPQGSSVEDQILQPSSASVVIPSQLQSKDQSSMARGKQTLVKEGGEINEAQMVAVPVHQARAVFKATAKEIIQKTQAGKSKSHKSKSKSLISLNPFASLSPDRNDEGLLVKRTLGSGPLKRARPEVSLPKRVSSNLVKGSGEGHSIKAISQVEFSLPPACLTQPLCDLNAGQEMEISNPDCHMDQIGVSSSGDGGGQSSGSTEVVTVDQLAGPLQISVDGIQSDECHYDSFMVEDQEGVPSTSS